MRTQGSGSGSSPDSGSGSGAGVELISEQVREFISLEITRGIL